MAVFGQPTGSQDRCRRPTGRRLETCGFRASRLRKSWNAIGVIARRDARKGRRQGLVSRPKPVRVSRHAGDPVREATSDEGDVWAVTPGASIFDEYWANSQQFTESHHAGANADDAFGRPD